MTISKNPLVSEFFREFATWKSYRANAFSSIIMWTVIFPLLIFTLINIANDSGLSYNQTEYLVEASLIGFLVWKLCTGVLVPLTKMIELESGEGTLEIVTLTAQIPFPLLIFYRIIAISVKSFIEVCLLAVSFVILSYILPISPLAIFAQVSPLAIFVLILTLIGVWGVGFILSSLAMIYKNVSNITSLVAYLAFTISGAFIPIYMLDIFNFLKLFFPMTWGINILRNIMLYGYDLSRIIYDNSLLGLILHCVIMVSIGYTMLKYSLTRVKERGELGTY